MEKITLTTLRQRLFQVADRVLHTGVPVAIERRGKRLLLAPERVTTSRIANLKRRKLIRGDAESLVNAKVGKWREPENLA
jgi:hypothetical protein